MLKIFRQGRARLHIFPRGGMLKAQNHCMQRLSRQLRIGTLFRAVYDVAQKRMPDGPVFRI